MLVTSIFSFFHSVFYPNKNRYNNLSNIQFVVCKCFEFGRVQKLSFGKEFEVLQVFSLYHTNLQKGPKTEAGQLLPNLQEIKTEKKCWKIFRRLLQARLSLQKGGVLGVDLERRPHNHKVSSSIHGSWCQLWNCL